MDMAVMSRNDDDSPCCVSNYLMNSLSGVGLLAVCPPPNSTLCGRGIQANARLFDDGRSGTGTYTTEYSELTPYQLSRHTP